MAETAANSNDLPDIPEAPLHSPGWTHSVFFRTHAPRLEALIRSRLSRRFQMRFDAEDVVQSAFRSFFLRQTPAQNHMSDTPSTSDGDLWPLLAEIAVCKLSQQIRRHSAQRRNVASDVSSETEIASTVASPDDAASLSEVIELAQSELDEPARSAFTLRLEGFEILEIAERLQISERTVRRQLSSAKQILQRLLDFHPDLPIANPSVPLVADLHFDLPFENYRLHQWIGDGAVGNVYRATEKPTGRTVAIKFLKKAFQFHPQAVASFRHEVQIVAQLNHPGIIRITGLGTARSRAQSTKSTASQPTFLVMDWASGGDLARHTAAHSPTLHAIRNWALELTQALQHSHQHDVIHCDLKPSNVLIGSTGQLVISDFGLARQLVGWSNPCMSQGGTPGFIAPELVDPAWGAVGPASDVFGLGAILFNLLTGGSVYQGTTLNEVMANIVGHEPIRWPQDIQNQIPKAWQSAVNSLLVKSVADRCPDMREAQAIIQSLTT